MPWALLSSSCCLSASVHWAACSGVTTGIVARQARLVVVHAAEKLPLHVLRSSLDEFFVAEVDAVLQVQQVDHQADGRPAGLMPPSNSPSNAPAKSSHITRLVRWAWWASLGVVAASITTLEAVWTTAPVGAANRSSGPSASELCASSNSPEIRPQEYRSQGISDARFTP